MKLKFSKSVTLSLLFGASGAFASGHTCPVGMVGPDFNTYPDNVFFTFNSLPGSDAWWSVTHPESAKYSDDFKCAGIIFGDGKDPAVSSAGALVQTSSADPALVGLEANGNTAGQQWPSNIHFYFVEPGTDNPGEVEQVEFMLQVGSNRASMSMNVYDSDDNLLSTQVPSSQNYVLNYGSAKIHRFELVGPLGSGHKIIDNLKFGIPAAVGGASGGVSGGTSGASGDPHFKTWKGKKYDFHGECQLELVSDPNFLNKGLKVYIRTKIVRNWSYIETAAIQLGEDILEVHGGIKELAYWVNGIYQGDLTMLGGFPVRYKKASSKSHSFVIDLGNHNEIEIRTYKEFIRVDFKKPQKELYGNTVGLLGDFVTGKRLARDGVTILDDDNEFGQEWQVMPATTQLFHEVSGPQAPFQKCILPNHNAVQKHRHRHHHRHRHLREQEAAEVTEMQAKTACEVAGVSEDDIDSCIFDILATEDLDMAGSY